MMYVLDTSAVLAVMLDEPGADLVIAAMPTAEMSVINVAEVYSKTLEQGGDLELTRHLMIGYGIRIRSFREVHAMRVAELRPLTKQLGLSLGDRACLAQGEFSKRAVLTADRDWAKLDIGIEVQLLR